MEGVEVEDVLYFRFRTCCSRASRRESFLVNDEVMLDNRVWRRRYWELRLWKEWIKKSSFLLSVRMEGSERSEASMAAIAI